MRHALTRLVVASLVIASCRFAASALAAAVPPNEQPPLPTPAPLTKVVPIDSVCRSAKVTDTRTTTRQHRQPAPARAHDAAVCAPVINVVSAAPTPTDVLPVPTIQPVATITGPPPGTSTIVKTAETKSESTKFGFDFFGLFKADFQSADMTFVWTAFIVVVALAIGMIVWNHWKAKNQPEKKPKVATGTIVLFVLVALLFCFLLSIRISKGNDVEAITTQVEQLVVRRVTQLEADSRAAASSGDTATAAQLAALRAELAIRDAQYASDRRVVAEVVNSTSRSGGSPDSALLLGFFALLALVAGIASITFAMTKRNAEDRVVSDQLLTLEKGQELARTKLDGVVETLERRHASEAAAKEPLPPFAAIHRVEDEAELVRHELGTEAVIPVNGESTIEIDPLFVALTKLRSALEADAVANGEYVAVVSPAPTGTGSKRPPLRRPVDEKTKGDLDKALGKLLDTLAQRVDPSLTWRTSAIVTVRETRRLLVGLNPPQNLAPAFANKT